MLFFILGRAVHRLRPLLPDWNMPDTCSTAGTPHWKQPHIFRRNFPTLIHHCSLRTSSRGDRDLLKPYCCDASRFSSHSQSTSLTYSQMAGHNRFSSLPAEIRIMIYKEILVQVNPIRFHIMAKRGVRQVRHVYQFVYHNWYLKRHDQPRGGRGLLVVSKAISAEACATFYHCNAFQFVTDSRFCSTGRLAWAMLEHFLITIGPRNVAHLREIILPFLLRHHGMFNNVQSWDTVSFFQNYAHNVSRLQACATELKFQRITLGKQDCKNSHLRSMRATIRLLKENGNLASIELVCLERDVWKLVRKRPKQRPSPTTSTLVRLRYAQLVGSLLKDMRDSMPRLIMSMVMLNDHGGLDVIKWKHRLEVIRLQGWAVELINGADQRSFDYFDAEGVRIYWAPMLLSRSEEYLSHMQQVGQDVRTQNGGL